tara:strand:- start:9 stop:644 length:636 start_codon:yes stop_codon:yes gene_type:complete
MNSQEIKSIAPPNVGWLEYRLNSKEMDYVWRCIENKKKNCKSTLAGNISSSYELMDRGDWFWLNVIHPLLLHYEEKFENIGRGLPTKTKHPYYMGRWWVNYQKQHEFNPLHNHNGVYSFVIWMKIPFSWEKQNKKDIARKSNTPSISSFEMSYMNVLGNTKTYGYNLSEVDEGRMLFFPAKMNHGVYPFYDCDEDRISISGNVMVDTTKKF